MVLLNLLNTNDVYIRKVCDDSDTNDVYIYATYVITQTPMTYIYANMCINALPHKNKKIFPCYQFGNI